VITSEEYKKENKRVRIAGQIRSVQRKTSKRGNLFATVFLEDLDASVNVIVLGKVYDEYMSELKQNALVRITGKISMRDETEVDIRAEKIESLSSDNLDEPKYAFQIKLNSADCTDEYLLQIRNILASNSGNLPVRLEISDGWHASMIDIRANHRVENSPQLVSDLANFVTSENLQLIAMR
jgi:DNA polymerase-3 subunit alpha